MQNALLASKFTKRMDNYLSIHGISFTEYLIMYYLNTSPLKTMRRVELAEQVGISPSGVTRLIAPMEKIKLVEKEANPRDARQSLVKLSKVGQQLFKESSVSFEDCAAELSEKLTEAQLDKIVELYRKFL